MARLTQQLFMVQILSGKKVPSNQKIAQQMQLQFPGCAIMESTVKWYISRYRLGMLQGQDGRAHEVSRKDQPLFRKKRVNKVRKRKKSATRKVATKKGGTP